MLAACFMLSGCMTVQVDSGGGNVRVVRHFGALQLEVAPPTRSLIARVQGVGIFSSPLGMSAGYTQQQLAMLGPECRAVLWVSEASRLSAEVRAELQQLAGLCLNDTAPHPPHPAASAALLSKER